MYFSFETKLKHTFMLHWQECRLEFWSILQKKCGKSWRESFERVQEIVLQAVLKTVFGRILNSLE